MRMFIRLAASLVGTAALLAAIVALALHFWPGSQKVTVAAAALSPILFVASIALAVVCFATARAWLRMVLVIAVAAGGVWVQAPLWRAEEAPAGPGLTVLTTNLQLGKGDVAALAKVVRERRIDVLAVQEITPEAAQGVAASSIAADLPNSFVRSAPLAYGTALYSRFPLSSTAEIPGFALKSLTAVAAVPGRGDVQLFALHPVPPTSDGWADELRRIETLLRGVPEPKPVIALGDYNATHDHAQFRRLLTDGYGDAGRLAGAGWLPTYPTDKAYPAMVGIDHVLVRGLKAADVTLHEIPGADHKALSARVG